METAKIHHRTSNGKYPYNIQEIRQREYPMLAAKTYFDHAGATIYAKSLIERSSGDLISNLYGNPHSESSPSVDSGRKVDNIRLNTLRFFNADPQYFDLIFVSNATAGVKLVMDGFRDSTMMASSASKQAKGKNNRGFWYGYHRDCHTSLVGLREVTSKGSSRCFFHDDEVEQWIKEAGSAAPKRSSRPRQGQVGLFAYPGQSNMTGRRLPLDWISRIRKAYPDGSMYTLLDAAALATTSPLDLSDHETAPDFTCLSFYKIFGYPDLGALIVRKAAAPILKSRRAFFGGTVDMVISLGASWHAKKETSLHDRLEDGTLPFHSIIALGHAINVHRELYKSMEAISAHTASLTKSLYDGLVGLSHYNGQPLVRIYNDSSAIYGDSKTQGATIAFNLMRSDGLVVGYKDVERLADKNGIYLRSGSLCNPGGFATYLSWALPDLRQAYKHGHSCSHPVQVIGGKPTGVVRVSLGAMSTIEEVHVFLEFLRKSYVESAYHLAVPFLRFGFSEEVSDQESNPGSSSSPSSDDEDEENVYDGWRLQPTAATYGRQLGFSDQKETQKRAPLSCSLPTESSTPVKDITQGDVAVTQALDISPDFIQSLELEASLTVHSVTVV